MDNLRKNESHERLASVIAKRIVEEATLNQFRIGQIIGTEKELMDQFKVSRDPLREAVRILEWQGIVESTRGRSGGVRLLSGADSATQEMLRTYLQLRGISLTELMECAAILSPLILSEAASSASMDEIMVMRKCVGLAREARKASDKSHEPLGNLSRSIYGTAKNPVAKVFMQMLSDSIEGFAYAGKSARILEARVDRNIDWFESIVDAIERHEPGTAIYASEQMSIETFGDLLIEEKDNRKTWNTSDYLLGSYKQALNRAKGSKKGAIQLAYRIAAYIERRKLPPGSKLVWKQAAGNHSPVSRALSRECMRLLEFFGVIEVKMGKLGGVHVAHPNSTRIVEWVSTYLRISGVTTQQVNELRHKVELAIAVSHAPKISTAGVLQLKADLEQLADNQSASGSAAGARKIILGIYSLVNNRVMSLLGEILVKLGSDDQRNNKSWRNSTLIQERIVDCSSRLSTAFLKQEDRSLISVITDVRDIANSMI